MTSYRAGSPLRLGFRRSAPAWIVVACVALLLGTGASAAPEPDASVQRPTKGPPVLPEAAEPVPDHDVRPPDAGTEPESEPVPDPESESEPAPEPGSGGRLEPRPSPSAPTGPFDVPDRALADAAWEGVIGQDVVLKLEGDRTTRGRVTAVQRDTFTLIEKGTGVVLVLPKRGVISLRGYVPPEPPEQTGVGMIVGGSILTSIGIPVFTSGAVILGVCPECTGIHLPLLLIGGGALGGGIPMLVRGAKQRRAYSKAVQEHALSASVLRTRQGWAAGLSLRF